MANTLVKPEMINAGPLTGFRNKVINGGFVVNQRGTTFNAAADQDFTSDRWVHHRDGSGATVNITVVGFPVGQTTPPISSEENYLQYDQTVAGSGGTYTTIRQRIEDVHTLAGKKATVTFWAEASPTIDVTFVQNFGSGGSPSSGVTTSVVSSLSVAASWTKYTYVVDIPSISGKTLGSNGDDCLELRFLLQANTVQTLRLAHVSVVEGDATAEDDPFSPRHISEEEALCYRYFQALGWGGGTCIVGIGYSSSTTQTRAVVPSSVRMRTENPTTSIASGSYTNVKVVSDASGTQSVTAVTAGRNYSGGIYMTITHSALTSGDLVGLRLGGEHIWIDDEL